MYKMATKTTKERGDMVDVFSLPRVVMTSMFLAAAWGIKLNIAFQIC